MGNLLSKLIGEESKVHQCHVDVKERGFVKCVKPNGEVYAFVAKQLNDRIIDGSIEIVKEDEKNGIIFFTYKGSSAPKFS